MRGVNINNLNSGALETLKHLLDQAVSSNIEDKYKVRISPNKPINDKMFTKLKDYDLVIEYMPTQDGFDCPLYGVWVMDSTQDGMEYKSVYGICVAHYTDNNEFCIVTLNDDFFIDIDIRSEYCKIYKPLTGGYRDYFRIHYISTIDTDKLDIPAIKFTENFLKYVKNRFI